MKTAFGVALAVLLASAVGVAGQYGYGGYGGYSGSGGSYGEYGYGYAASGPCSIHLNFTSHSDTSYKCGDNWCKVIQVAVTNYAPYAIPYGWGMTLTSGAWAGDWAVFAWWNCNNMKLAHGTMSLNSNAQWQTLDPHGGTESFGFILSGPTNDNAMFTPQRATLNGRACSII